MRLYHVTPTTTAANNIRKNGADPNESAYQGGGFYLWASLPAAENFLNDPWIVSRLDPDKGPPQILEFEVDPNDLTPDIVIGYSYVKEWMKKNKPFYAIPKKLELSDVETFIEDLSQEDPAAFERLNHYTLQKLIQYGSSVKYVGKKKIFPVDNTVTEAVFRRLLSFTW